MTIIAWDGNILAADRRSTSSGIAFERTKIIKHNGHLIGSTGEVDMGEALKAWFVDGAKKEDYPVKNATDSVKATLVIITPDKNIHVYYSMPYPARLENKHYAIGAGDAVALGAMYMGADARKAVEAAIAICPSCGNGIDVLSL